MRKISACELYGMDFSIRFINSLKQNWRQRKVFYQNTPKIHNIMVYLYKCSAVYTLLDGETILASDGDVVFAPFGSCYRVEFKDFESAESCTIGINLHLYDSDGQELLLSDRPFVAVSGEANACRELFRQVDGWAADDPPPMARIYGNLYSLFAEITESAAEVNYFGGKYATISGAIRHLRSEDAYTMKIADMAAECNVSESYLRRRFKEYCGMSPAQYVHQRRMQAVKQFLKTTDMSLDEIAYRLGFTDAAYLCKVFHRDSGVTPSQYRKENAG